MDAMQGGIWGEHIEEMKMVVMRDSVRVSRHLLGVRLTAKTALFSPSSSVAGVVTARRQVLADEKSLLSHLQRDTHAYEYS